MGPAEELMNLRAASRFLGCSPVTARRMVQRGDIPVVKLPVCFDSVPRVSGE